MRNLRIGTVVLVVAAAGLLGVVGAQAVGSTTTTTTTTTTKGVVKMAASGITDHGNVADAPGEMWMIRMPGQAWTGAPLSAQAQAAIGLGWDVADYVRAGVAASAPFDHGNVSDAPPRFYAFRPPGQKPWIGNSSDVTASSVLAAGWDLAVYNRP